MMTRRRALAWAVVASASACGGAAVGGRYVATPARPPSVVPLGAPVDWIPAAGLLWLLDARPIELLANAELARALATVAPAAWLDALATRYGGVDLRRARAISVAGYGDATLVVLRASFVRDRVEAAFAARALSVEGHTREADETRIWGTVEGASEQLALFGDEALALERGRFGPLRVARYFALKKLKRALPALRADPLADAASRVGDAPLRAFVPGPFDGEMASALAGLLRATTAVGIALRSADASDGQSAGARVRLVLCGAWGDDAPAAAAQLGAAFHALGRDPLGHMMGLDRPLSPPRTLGSALALELEVALDPLVTAAGMRAATGASLAEILGLSPAH